MRQRRQRQRPGREAAAREQHLEAAAAEAQCARSLPSWDRVMRRWGRGSVRMGAAGAPARRARRACKKLTVGSAVQGCTVEARGEANGPKAEQAEQTRSQKHAGQGYSPLYVSLVPAAQPDPMEFEKH